MSSLKRGAKSAKQLHAENAMADIMGNVKNVVVLGGTNHKVEAPTPRLWYNHHLLFGGNFVEKNWY